MRVLDNLYALGYVTFLLLLVGESLFDNDDHSSVFGPTTIMVLMIYRGYVKRLSETIWCFIAFEFTNHTF